MIYMYTFTVRFWDFFLVFCCCLIKFLVVVPSSTYKSGLELKIIVKDLLSGLCNSRFYPKSDLKKHLKENNSKSTNQLCFVKKMRQSNKRND